MDVKTKKGTKAAVPEKGVVTKSSESKPKAAKKEISEKGKEEIVKVNTEKKKTGARTYPIFEHARYIVKRDILGKQTEQLSEGERAAVSVFNLAETGPKVDTVQITEVTDWDVRGLFSDKAGPLLGIAPNTPGTVALLILNYGDDVTAIKRARQRGSLDGIVDAIINADEKLMSRGFSGVSYAKFTKPHDYIMSLLWDKKGMYVYAEDSLGFSVKTEFWKAEAGELFADECVEGSKEDTVDGKAKAVKDVSKTDEVFEYNVDTVTREEYVNESIDELRLLPPVVEQNAGLIFGLKTGLKVSAVRVLDVRDWDFDGLLPPGNCKHLLEFISDDPCSVTLLILNLGEDVAGIKKAAARNSIDATIRIADSRLISLGFFNVTATEFASYHEYIESLVQAPRALYVYTGMEPRNMGKAVYDEFQKINAGKAYGRVLKFKTHTFERADYESINDKGDLSDTIEQAAVSVFNLKETRPKVSAVRVIEVEDWDFDGLFLPNNSKRLLNFISKDPHTVTLLLLNLGAEVTAIKRAHENTAKDSVYDTVRSVDVKLGRCLSFHNLTVGEFSSWQEYIPSLTQASCGLYVYMSRSGNDIGYAVFQEFEEQCAEKLNAKKDEARGNYELSIGFKDKNCVAVSWKFKGRTFCTGEPDERATMNMLRKDIRAKMLYAIAQNAGTSCKGVCDLIIAIAKNGEEIKNDEIKVAYDIREKTIELYYDLLHNDFQKPTF